MRKDEREYGILCIGERYSTFNGKVMVVRNCLKRATGLPIAIFLQGKGFIWEI